MATRDTFLYILKYALYASCWPWQDLARAVSVYKLDNKTFYASLYEAKSSFLDNA